MSLSDMPNSDESGRAEITSPEHTSSGNTAIIDPETAFRAHRIIQRGRTGNRLFTLGLSLALFWVGVRAVLFGRILVGSFSIAFGVWLLLKVFFFTSNLRRTIYKQYEQMGKDREVVTFVPTDEHLRIITDESDVRIKWSDFHKWKEADDLILAYRHDNFAQIIPIAQLDEQTQNRIRENLSAYSGRR